jgi:hypothetical protein
VLPYTLLNGTLADAGQVMGNFNAVVSCIGTFGSASANYVLAGPASGLAAAPTFRPLVSADLPNPIAVSGTISTSNTTASTSYLTGAITDAGGMGIAGALNALGAIAAQGGLTVSGAAVLSGVLTISNTTQSSSSTTGALTVAGGVGIVGNLYVSGKVGMPNLGAGSAPDVLCYNHFTGIISYATAASGCALGAAN